MIGLGAAGPALRGAADPDPRGRARTRPRTGRGPAGRLRARVAPPRPRRALRRRLSRRRPRLQERHLRQRRADPRPAAALLERRHHHVGGETLRFVWGEETRDGREPPAGDRDPAAAARGDAADDRARPRQRRRARRPERLALPRRGPRADGDAVELATSARATAPASTAELVKRRAGSSRAPRSAIGPYRLVFDGDRLVARDERGALRLDARGRRGARSSDKQILQPTLARDRARASSSPSSARAARARRTLIKVLAGVDRPDRRARCTVNGEPVSPRLTDIGYVPQDEIVHGELTVARGAALRRAAAAAARTRPTPTIDDGGRSACSASSALERARRDRGSGRSRAASASAPASAAELLSRPEPAVPRRADDRARPGARDAA